VLQQHYKRSTVHLLISAVSVRKNYNVGLCDTTAAYREREQDCRAYMYFPTHENFIAVKQPNYDFGISQGSVATILRWIEQNHSQLHLFLHDVACKIIKINQWSRKLFKNKSETFWVDV